MIRTRWLIPALLCVPLPAGAQAPEWKAIACTVENPESARGDVLTIYFLESGQVHFRGRQRPASVNTAEIHFCYLTDNAKQGCYTISRISGRFTFAISGSSASVNGGCIPEGTKPKF
jgi:hypothetical protein